MAPRKQLPLPRRINDAMKSKATLRALPTGVPVAKMAREAARKREVPSSNLGGGGSG
jgi:hypothetical protein